MSGVDSGDTSMAATLCWNRPDRTGNKTSSPYLQMGAVTFRLARTMVPVAVHLAFRIFLFADLAIGPQLTPAMTVALPIRRRFRMIRAVEVLRNLSLLHGEDTHDDEQ